jgi:tyrosinase
MYLFQLENIVRSFLTAAEAKTWALPYWNYSQGAPSNSLPPCFREQILPDGSPNPLFVPQRRASVNAGNPLPAGVTNIQTALSEDQFVDGASGTTPAGFGGPVTGFAHFGAVAGELENLPHNVVHVSVGGPGGLMTDPNTAALDPIFYLHHSNIDRLWNLWLTTAPHANPTSTKWLNKSFKLRDASGAKVTMKTKDVLDTVAQLDYKYA